MSFLKSPKNYANKHKYESVVFFVFFVPIFLPVLLDTTLFDGWRHHYFVYPPFVVVSIIGFKGIVGFVNKMVPGRMKRVVLSGIVAIIIMSLIQVYH